MYLEMTLNLCGLFIFLTSIFFLQGYVRRNLIDGNEGFPRHRKAPDDSRSVTGVYRWFPSQTHQVTIRDVDGVYRILGNQV